jgi:hypothetical protein
MPGKKKVIHRSTSVVPEPGIKSFGVTLKVLQVVQAVTFTLHRPETT